jgi:hypothetical protein
LEMLINVSKAIKWKYALTTRHFESMLSQYSK